MARRYRTDVLVAGAGPVGLFAALELVERGIKVEVIDDQWRTAARSYALALHPGSLELLERHGLASELLGHGHRIDAIAFYDGGERRAEIDLSRLEGKYPFVLVLPQQALEDAFEKRLAEKGVQVHWSHRLAALETGGRRARARIDQLREDEGGYVSSAGRWVIERTIETRSAFVLGADGFHSAVRRALAIDFEETAPRQLFGIFELDAAFEPAREVRVVLDEAGAAVLWPMRDDRLRWSFQLGESWEVEPRKRAKSRRVVQVGEDTYPYLSVERLQALTAARAPWFDASVGDIAWSVAVRFEQRLASSFGREHAWLLGDAAHVTTPMGVQSMNVGFREAHDLTVAIDDVLRRDASPEVLETWGRERREEWRSLLGLDAGLAAASGTPDWVRRRRDRIVPCIPASGADLERLLRQIGLEPAS